MIVQNALRAAGTGPEILGFDTLKQAGVDYAGLTVLGSGALLSAMMLTAILVFLIDGRFMAAFVWTIIASGLSYIGLIHSEVIDPGRAGGPALGYLLMALLFLLLDLYRARRENGGTTAAKTPEDEAE